MDKQKTAFDCLKEDLEAKSIPTSSHKLDKALGEGFRLRTVSEIVGNSGSGKTQICLQLAVNTVMPDGFIDGEVIFICTKHSFFPKRINQLIDHCSNIWNSLEKDQKIASKPELKFTREDALNKIYYMRVLSLPELISSIYKAKHFVENESNKVRLIIVDCFATFLIDLEPEERNRIIYEMLFILEEVAEKQDCAVILTNDMTTLIIDNSFDSLFQTQFLKPALGEAFHHRIQQRIVLSKSQSDPQIVIANVQKNVSQGPSLVRFKITKDGIQDA